MSKFENMRFAKGILFGIIGLMVFASCKKKNEEPMDEPIDVAMLRIDVLPVYGAEVLYLDSVHSTSEGYKVKFTDIKFYFEDVRNGSTQLSDAGLFDYRVRGTKLIEAEGVPADFPSLQGNIGVDAAINHNDPSAFSNSSWLNISNANDMHWGWNPGYIFLKIEGKVDTLAGATEVFDQNIVFHIGLDANLNSLSLNNLNWMSSGGNDYNLPIQLDMLEFLNGTISGDPIDLKTEYSSHSVAGQEAITTNVATNFKDALTLY